MLNYEVMSEEQAESERFQLLKEGEYDAVITSSVDKQSSTGNPMMDIMLTVYDAEGKTHTVRDFLVFTRSMMWKIIHCADSAGVLPEYHQGRFCSNTVINKNVRVKISIEEGRQIADDKLQGKPVGSKYPDKNKVAAYIKKAEQKPLGHTLPKDEQIDEDDDVPF